MYSIEAQHEGIQHPLPVRIWGLEKPYFVNVFRDNKGETHYSTEEFSIGTDGIFTFEDALEDAYQYSIIGDWHYVCTLSNLPKDVSLKMRRRLSELDQARFVIEECGRPLSNYTSNDIEEAARDLREDA